MGVIAKTPADAVPANGEFFKDLSSEVSDKGFVVTSTEDLFTWARTALYGP